MTKFYLPLLFLVSLLTSSFSFPASPNGFNETQKDGSVTPTLYIHGERNHYVSDSSGYTVIRDDNGWVYAEIDKRTGKLISSGLRVGQTIPKEKTDLVKGAPPELHNNITDASKNFTLFKKDLIPITYKTGTQKAIGELTNLVVLIRFADHKERELPSRKDFDKLMNTVGGHTKLAPTGSVRDVFLESSYGKLDVKSTVNRWITVSKKESYYGDKNTGFTEKLEEAFHEALNHLDNSLFFSFSDYDIDDDGKIDAITFIHSGYGAEWGGKDSDGQDYSNRIWSHKSTMRPWISKKNIEVDNYHISTGFWGTSGSSITHIGVIAHELGHFLGLDDMSRGGVYGLGIGCYGLMGNPWGFDASQYYPPPMDAYNKILLGWASPVEITRTGRYFLESSTKSPTIYKISHGFPSNEYLLIENRYSTGFDSKIPQDGLAIWHINENAKDETAGYPGQSGWPRNNNNPSVSLLQADGKYDLERAKNNGDSGDFFHADGVSFIGPSTSIEQGPFPNTDSYQYGSVVQTQVRIHSISKAGETMSFVYSLSGDPTKSPTNEPTQHRTNVPTKGPTDNITIESTILPITRSFGSTIDWKRLRKKTFIE